MQHNTQNWRVPYLNRGTESSEKYHIVKRPRTQKFSPNILKILNDDNAQHLYGFLKKYFENDTEFEEWDLVWIHP